MPELAALEDAIERAARAEQQAAEAALALDVLSRMAGLTSEEAVADVVLEFAQVMFGAGAVRMTVLDRRGHPARAWERGTRGVTAPVEPAPCPGAAGEAGIQATGDGLRVPLAVEGRRLGLLELRDLPLPEDLDRYAPTVWVVARVAAMALANVRALHGLVPICAGCRKIRDEAGGWHTLERWLAANSDAQLSHGLCPSCFAQAERDAGLEPSGGVVPE